MKVAVIGAGKMGLPLACQFATRGATVSACDIRQDVVDAINAGRCSIDEPGVPELLSAAIANGRLRATTDIGGSVAASEVVVVIVPALLTADNDADLGALCSVSQQIAANMHRGLMVSYETTVPVGTTRHRFLPILESSGLKAGRDFDLAYSPERVKSQFVLRHLASTPKVVGGITPQAAERAADFYGHYLGAKVMNVGSLEAAELVKLAGMLYRDVNIALANELARYSEALGIDLGPVIEAANTDGEAAIHLPGIGVGGHCTPIYPYFLIRDGERRGIPFILADRSRRINDGQATHAINRIERILGPLAGRRVLILGLGFRPSVKEHILSPAFLLAPELRKRGADVRVHDPMYSEAEIRDHGFIPGSLEQSPSPEVIILNTAHPQYANLDFKQLATQGLRVVCDGRRLWPAESVRASSLHYIGIGQPDEVPAGEPVIAVAKPVLAGNEAEAAANVVRSGWVMQGPQVAQFEREFAARVGAPHACAVSSGTTALHLALLAVGVRPDDEVITVSHSYIATANSIRYCGAVPVFADIDPDTFNLDPKLIEAAITPRTRAILCVHQMGMPCELAAVLHIARKHRIAVVEDAACAIGSEILWEGEWQKIGRPHGDVACFSFHPRKLVTTGDGGMIVTANGDWDRQFRLWRSHGMSQQPAEHYPVLGYNYRMTDIQAAIGREQLRRLPEMIARRRALADRYRELLRGTEVTPPAEPSNARSNWQSYCVRLPQGADQATVMDAMQKAGISTRRGVMCAHREPAYAHEPWRAGGPLRKSEEAQDQCLILPLYPQMSEGDPERVVKALLRALATSMKEERVSRASR